MKWVNCGIKDLDLAHLQVCVFFSKELERAETVTARSVSFEIWKGVFSFFKKPKHRLKTTKICKNERKRRGKRFVKKKLIIYEIYELDFFFFSCKVGEEIEENK
jgi:hypothetical protein